MSVDLLEYVWSDGFEMRDAAGLSPLAQTLTSLLAAPMVCFTTNAVTHQEAEPIATYAGEEVMPGATLADVLYQEHQVEVSDDTIVYIEPNSLSEVEIISSDELGKTIGRILVQLAQPGQTEAQALSGAALQGAPARTGQAQPELVQ